MLARLAGGQHLNVRDAIGTGTVHCAVQSRSQKLLDVIISEGGDVNAVDKNGMQPIHVAAAQGDPAHAAALLSAGAVYDSVDRDGNSALHIAAMHGNIKVVDMLIQFAKERTLPPNAVPVLSASVADSSLAKRRSKARGESSEKGDAGSHVEFVNARERKWGWTALHYAARIGNKDIISSLLEGGADPHAASTNDGEDKQTALAIARDAGHAEACGRLHEALMKEPLHVVWPLAGHWVEPIDGPDVPWRYVRSARLKHTMEKRERRGRKMLRGSSQFTWHRGPTEEDDHFKNEGETERCGEIWLGSRQAAQKHWVEKKGIEVVLTLMDGATLDIYPKISWLQEQDSIEHIHFSLNNKSTPESWKKFAKSLSNMIGTMWNYYKSGKRILLCSPVRTSHSLSRPATAALAFLMTKFKLNLDEGMAILAERCYFYVYRDANLKTGWLKREAKELTIPDAAREAIERDTNTCSGKKGAGNDYVHDFRGWTPGVPRTQPNPSFLAGLEDMQARLHARRLEKYRRSQVEFAKSFYTC